MEDEVSCRCMLQHRGDGSLADFNNIDCHQASTFLPIVDCSDCVLYVDATTNCTVRPYTVRFQSGGKMKGEGRGAGVRDQNKFTVRNQLITIEDSKREMGRVRHTNRSV